MTEKILFYSTNDEYGEFSNFARYSIQLKGRTWPTSEHYFQAQKYAGTPWERNVRNAKTPKEAARIGRDRKGPLRQDWEDVKDNVMREALYAKFTQHPALKAKLISTGDAKIVEHTDNDSYWGDGGDGSGKNRLGTLLMELRTRFRSGA